MTYNLFLHSSSGRSPILMFRWEDYIPILFALLLSKIRYLGDKKCRILLDAMREVDMMAALSLKTARDKCPPPINDPNIADIKLEDILKNHTLMRYFDSKYKPKLQNPWATI